MSTPVEIPLPLSASFVEVSKRQFAILHLLLNFGGGLVADDGTESVPGDHSEAGVAIRRLLARLDDDACCLQFDQGVMGLGCVHWDIDDQTRRLLVVEKGVNLFPQHEEAVGVTGDLRIWQIKVGNGTRVRSLRVEPDHQSAVIDLLGDQLEQVIGHGSHYLTSPFCRSFLPMLDHSYSPFMRSSQ